MNVDRRCLECGAILVRSRREIRNRTKTIKRKFCDLHCAGAFKSRSGKRPYKRSTGGIDEHRKVMQTHLKRQLARREHVHHKNRDTRDNCIENLEVLDAGNHARLHQEKHPKAKTCASCGQQYEPPPKHRGRSKTCSKECRYKFISELFRDPSRPK